jgi:phospholipase B1
LVTLPNILRSAGARALGRSTGSNPSGLPPGSGSDAGFNVAVSTAAAAQIVNQARSLIIDLRSSREINFVEDWKVVTIWIGTNDLCAMCDDNPQNQPAEYIKYLEQTLDIFERDVPRAYVNVVPVFDVTKIADVNTGLCDLWHNQFCACGTSANPAERAQVRAAAAEMQRLTAALVAERKYHDSIDFTVELQPFLESTQIPLSGDGEPNAAYFAPDCFHWSKLGQELIAKGTWNNMMQPPDAKSLSVAPGDELLCPSNDRPYICTLTNNCGARPPPAAAEQR